MEKYFATSFEDVRNERSVIPILSPTDERILRQTGFTDLEVNRIKKFALEKLHRQKSMEEYFTL